MVLEQVLRWTIWVLLSSAAFLFMFLGLGFDRGRSAFRLIRPRQNRRGLFLTYLNLSCAMYCILLIASPMDLWFFMIPFGILFVLIGTPLAMLRDLIQS